MANPFEGGKSPSFKISKKAHHFYQSFCDKGKSQVDSCGLFRKYTNLFTLCAIIGHVRGEKKDLGDKTENPFTLEQIDEEKEWPALISVAWSDSNKDISIFMNSKKIIEICEQYAEAGFQYIEKQYPFNEIYLDDVLHNTHKTIKLEYQVALLVQQLKKDSSKIIT